MLLDRLVEELATVQLDGVVPAAEVDEEKERVVGTLPEELRPLYVLYAKAEEADFDMHAEIQARIDEAGGRLAFLLFARNEMEDLVRRAKPILAWYRTTKANFWLEVRAAFPDVLPSAELGMRKDWQVVTPQQPVPLWGLLDATGGE